MFREFIRNNLTFISVIVFVSVFLSIQIINQHFYTAKMVHLDNLD